MKKKKVVALFLTHKFPYLNFYSILIKQICCTNRKKKVALGGGLWVFQMRFFTLQIY